MNIRSIPWQYEGMSAEKVNKGAIHTKDITAERQLINLGHVYCSV